ncbi:hypothetical protein OG21DRAFT_1509495 [Imleria badia]|nr:hypothetical protein OG21DRAFT_1509495 [Imleria badia]
MIRPVLAPRPPKRTRTSPDGSPSANSPPPSVPPPRQVKAERSPSPLSVEKKLVISGTKRFTPIPSDCLSSCTQYKQNRLEWVERCVKELEALNLIPERRLFRDDGLVIDWKSHVPVWSDTLQPGPQDLAATIMLTHRSNAQWHPPRKESPLKSVTTIPTQERPTSSPPISGDVSDAEPPLKKRLPAPPRPSSKRRNNPSQLVSFNSPPSEPRSSSPCSERPRISERETHSPSRDRVSSLSDPPTDISSQHGPIGVPPKSGGAGDQSIAPGTSSAAEEEMSEMTLNYLRR